MPATIAPKARALTRINRASDWFIDKKSAFPCDLRHSFGAPVNLFFPPDQRIGGDPHRTWEADMTTTVRAGQVTRFAELPETLVEELREMTEAGFARADSEQWTSQQASPFSTALRRIFGGRANLQ